MKDIKVLLQRLTISQEKFANISGISRQTIYNILNGKTNPSVLTIKRICNYYYYYLNEDVNWKDYIE